MIISGGDPLRAVGCADRSSNAGMALSRAPHVRRLCGFIRRVTDGAAGTRMTAAVCVNLLQTAHRLHGLRRRCTPIIANEFTTRRFQRLPAHRLDRRGVSRWLSQTVYCCAAVNDNRGKRLGDADADCFVEHRVHTVLPASSRPCPRSTSHFRVPIERGRALLAEHCAAPGPASVSRPMLIDLAGWLWQGAARAPAMYIASEPLDPESTMSMGHCTSIATRRESVRQRRSIA